MNRFSKGTTDHDSDGKMGGSRKGDDTMADDATKAAAKLLDKGVTKVPAKAAQKPAAPKRKAKPKAEAKAPKAEKIEEPVASADDEIPLRQAALGQL